MYRLLYTLGIKAYGLAISLAAPFHSKARQWKEGREDLFVKLRQSLDKEQNVLWFHAASLGEAEQGLPIIKELNTRHPSYRVLLSFFSPSGMNHFKAPPEVDHVFYLPLDTARNARQFLDAVNPKLAFFIKYEIWPNFFREIQHRQIPLVVAPAIFRPGQHYFKSPHRQFFLPLLRKVDRIMVQDQKSAQLLKKHEISSQVVGDSRFDRVLENTRQPFEDKTLSDFGQDGFVVVAGSSWEPEEKILKQLLDRYAQLRLIVAPHDISAGNIDRLMKLYGSEAFRYSSSPAAPNTFRVCLIDNIGLLSRLYRYGQVAMIGGAFGKGIHNSLEAVAYGLPVFFGPKHSNFIEPGEMLEAGFAFAIGNAEEMEQYLDPLLTDEARLEKLSALAEAYVARKKGSVAKIADEVDAVL